MDKIFSQIQKLTPKFNPKMSRRAFVKTASSATGLVIGFHLPVVGRLAFAQQQAAPIYPPNAFIRIAPDNTVTILISKLEFGQGVFTSMPMLVAEELECNWKDVRAEHAPVAPVYNHTMFGIQMTGGSTSIATSYDQMRTVGAKARVMLIQAAANQWKVDAKTCKAEKGYVIHTTSKKKLSYGELANAANALPLPDKVTLKDPKNFKIIGKPTKRLDALEKSNGTAKFSLDMQLPDMVVAVVARSPVFGGKLSSYSDSKAKKIKGVETIAKIPTGVAIIAKNFWAAKKAREALECKWDLGDGKTISSDKMREEYRALAKKPGAVGKQTGDVKKIGAKVITAEYTVPFLAHSPMEPLNCLVDLKKDSCKIWTGSQFQTIDRANAAQAAGLKPEQVDLITTLAGGGFGRRANAASDYIVEAVQVAKVAKKPVRVMWTRDDDLAGGWYRPAFLHQVTASLDTKGNPQSWEHTLVGQSIMAGTPFEPMMVKNGIDPVSVEGIVDMPYEFPNMLVNLHSPKSPIPVLWWRSVGHTHTAFVVETMIDELAFAAGKDPVAFRRALLKKHPRYLAALNLATQKAKWGSPLPKGRARGVAVVESFGSVVCHVVEASMEKGQPKIHKVTSAIDCGLAVNPLTIRAQVEGAMIYGLSAALYGKITLKDGKVEQTNFDTYPVVRMDVAPVCDVHIVPSKAPPTGVGEPGTPPVAPALANAIFALTKKRIRSLPITT